MLHLKEKCPNITPPVLYKKVSARYWAKRAEFSLDTPLAVFPCPPLSTADKRRHPASVFRWRTLWCPPLMDTTFFKNLLTNCTQYDILNIQNKGGLTHENNSQKNSSAHLSQHLLCWLLSSRQSEELSIFHLKDLWHFWRERLWRSSTRLDFILFFLKKLLTNNPIHAILKVQKERS